jgi:DNA uptake protein ComE-like DNA-binding protein
MRPFLVVTAVVLILAGRADAREWQTFKDCRLIEHSANDGDSFHVQAGEKEILIRLYFVDCPETTAGSDADAKRVREQALHFGLVKMNRVLHYGEEARKFVAQTLSKPFTVHTAFATALGRSSTPRVYGMITTADGKDLGTLLAEKGLAREYGVKRKTPDGIEGDQMAKRLEGIELKAMKQRAGIWSETDLGKLDEMRAQQRSEEEEMKELHRQLRGDVDGPVDINKATSRELQSIGGIGPVLASRIIERRPYKAVDDLLRVPGVNQRLLEQLRPRLTVSGSTEQDADH